MREDGACNLALGLNTFYFAAAATASVYVVAEAWHYGFWFTPFPLALTLGALAFIGAAILGLLCTTRGIAKYLLLCVFVQCLAFAATNGAYFSKESTHHNILTVMLSLVAIEALAIMRGTQIGLSRFPTWHLSAAKLTAIRNFALLLPIPIFMLAGLQFYVKEVPFGSPGIVQATTGYLFVERILFGIKRTNALCESLVRMHVRHGNLGEAETYARLGVMNAQNHPFPVDLEAYNHRLADEHEQLANVLVLEQDALGNATGTSNKSDTTKFEQALAEFALARKHWEVCPERTAH